MESAPSIEKPFKSLDVLISHLTSLPKPEPVEGEGNVQRIPIVLVHGLFDWATPDSSLYHVFGSCVDLAGVLAEQGWPIIVPHLGPLSSTWERACELYAVLSHDSKDGKSFDVLVDYGTPPANLEAPLCLDPEAPQWKRQARAFNLDPGWRWGPENPVHFVAHGHGANTCRYLIHLLENGESVEGSWYFTEKKCGWVRSLTTLAAPHNGTTLIPALERMGRTEILLNRLIAASSFIEPDKRPYDFSLDHRGIFPPRLPAAEDAASPKVDFLTYLNNLTGPDGALTKWRASKYNAFHDNSILGVVGSLNRIITRPSKHVYYLTLSFVCTEDVQGLSPTFGVADMLAMGHEMIMPKGNGADKEGEGWSGRGTMDMLTSLLPIPGLTFGPRKPKASSDVTHDSEKHASSLNTIVNFAGSTLQDMTLWALTHVNPRLHAVVPGPMVKTTRPRMDIWSPMLLWSFQMCSYVLTAKERKSIAALGGPTSCRAWHEHDGLVPTISQRGPCGPQNKIMTVDQMLATLPWGWKLGKAEEPRGVEFGLQKGVWIDLGEYEGMDHVECMGLFVDSRTTEEVKDLYVRIGKLLDLLPRS